MSDTPIIEISGLQLSNNTFSASPPGSLSDARNCVMPQKGVIEPRRGQERAYTFPLATQIPFSLAEFAGELLASYSPDKLTPFNLGKAAAPTVNYTGGPYNPVGFTGATANFGKMKFGFAGSYAHFCTTAGPKALETTAGPPRKSGLIRMPDPAVAMSSASGLGTSGVGLPYGSSRAYETLVRKPTSDGVSLLSPPSGRAVVTNRLVAAIGQMTRSGGATVTVLFSGATGVNPGVQVGDAFDLTPGEADFPAGPYTVASLVPNGFTYASGGANVSNTVAQDFDTGPRPVAVLALLSPDVSVSTPVRIYRSADTVSGSPSDEMFFVDEKIPTVPQIVNGFMPYLDITPESVINDPLYTNPQTGEGDKQENSPPPIYRDLDFWGARMWYAQTTEQQQFRLQMLGVGSPEGIQDGDTITITVDAVDYVFNFLDTPLTLGDVQIFSDGTPSSNIALTSQYLVGQICLVFRDLFASALPLQAYSQSGVNEPPGKMLLARVDFGSAFSVTVSRPGSWSPALDSVTPTSSVAENVPNGLAYSKLDEAESVPVINRTTVGSKNYAIERITGLQNSLLAFKSGDGIYSLTGSFPFQVNQISLANIVARDCCVKFADATWVYTDQGILRVSDSGGCSVVSRPIEVQLNDLRARFPDETRDYAFAVAYETERRVMFFVPVDVDDDGRPVLQAFCYCNATQAWTGPLDYGLAFSGNVGLVTNKLEMGVYDDEWATGRVTLERKTMTYLDMADASFAAAISAVDPDEPLVLELASLADVEVGDAIGQGQWLTKISEVSDDGSNTVTVYEEIPWSVAACTIYKGFDVSVQFNPTKPPTTRRTLSRLAFAFRENSFAAYAAKATVFTDQIQAVLEIDMPSLGYGLTPYGQGSYGNPSPLVRDVNPIKAQWANAAQFFVGVKAREAFLKMKLQGVVLQTDSASGPVARP